MKSNVLGSVRRIIDSPFNEGEMIAERLDGIYIIDRPVDGAAYKYQVIKRKANADEIKSLHEDCLHLTQFFNEAANGWLCEDCGKNIFSY